jgi:DNA adenine methylase
MPKRKAKYYALRKVSPSTGSSIERAVRFIYLNRFCFNGIYRTNRDGHFNVPYAAARTQSLPTRRHLNRAAYALRRARLIAGDFQATIEHVAKGDFVYLDPPYALSSRRMFRQYGRGSFSALDLPRLTGSLDLIDKRGATFVLSYAQCREADQFFTQWNVRRVHAHRNVGGFARRRLAIEVLVTNKDFPE